MTKITPEEVKHIAKLASLKISPSEGKLFSVQLSKVIDYINELKEIDTSNTEATSQTTNLNNVLREDKVINSAMSQEEALSNTDSTLNGYFKVSGILDKEP